MNLFCTVVFRNRHQSRVVVIAFKIRTDSRTLNWVAIQNTPLSTKRPRKTSDYDELLLINSNSMATSSLIQITKLFPFFCICIKRGDYIRGLAQVKEAIVVTTENVKRALQCNNTIRRNSRFLSEYSRYISNTCVYRVGNDKCKIFDKSIGKISCFFSKSYI